MQKDIKNKALTVNSSGVRNKSKERKEKEKEQLKEFFFSDKQVTILAATVEEAIKKYNKL